MQHINIRCPKGQWSSSDIKAEILRLVSVGGATRMRLAFGWLAVLEAAEN
jgi:hypothetical protein